MQKRYKLFGRLSQLLVIPCWSKLTSYELQSAWRLYEAEIIADGAFPAIFPFLWTSLASNSNEAFISISNLLSTCQVTEEMINFIMVSPPRLNAFLIDTIKLIAKQTSMRLIFEKLDASFVSALKTAQITNEQQEYIGENYDGVDCISELKILVSRRMEMNRKNYNCFQANLACFKFT